MDKNWKSLKSYRGTKEMLEDLEIPEQLDNSTNKTNNKEKETELRKIAKSLNFDFDTIYRVGAKFSKPERVRLNEVENYLYIIENNVFPAKIKNDVDLSYAVKLAEIFIDNDKYLSNVQGILADAWWEETERYELIHYPIGDEKE